MPVDIISNNTGAAYSGTDDCDLQSGSSTANNGSDTTFWAHSFALANYRIGLLRFAIPGAMAGGTVNSAVLRLWVNDNLATRTYELHKMLRNWVESQASWDLWSTGNPWATLGALGTADRSATVSSSRSIANSDIGGYITFSGAGLAADVQSWIDSGGVHGWNVVRDVYDAGDTSYVQFVSSEGTDGRRPELEIDWTPSGGGGSTLLRKLNHFLRA